MAARKETLNVPGLQNKRPSALRRYIERWAKRAANRWARWSINFDTRRQLLKLDQHELDDIGMSRHTALTEGNKPFWKD